MKRILVLFALGLVLAAAGALLRWTVFLDIEKFRDDLAWKAATGATGDFYAEMARRTHRGEGPCLRYVDRESILAEELARTADDAERSGVAAEVTPLFPLFLRWAQETDAPHHAADESEELLAATREHVHGLDRFLLALNFSRVLRSTRMRDQASMSRLVGEAERKVTPPLREQLHALWQRHPLALSIGGAIRLAPELKRRVTAAHMEHIAAAASKWRAAHGALPDRLEDLHLPGDDLKDGWYRDIRYERSGDGARLVSDEAGHPRIEHELR
jgi:hypothetical protein